MQTHKKSIQNKTMKNKKTERKKKIYVFKLWKINKPNCVFIRYIAYRDHPQRTFQEPSRFRGKRPWTPRSTIPMREPSGSCWGIVIKMISQVYYRHNLLIRNRNGISTDSRYRKCKRERQRERDRRLSGDLLKYFYCLLNWYFTFNRFSLPAWVLFFIRCFGDQNL